MGGLGFEFWSWWEYTGKITKAVTIIGLAAIIMLAIIIASPHVKPLQTIDKSLGLVQVQTNYVPMNHTVYVNQTIVKYVNQTVVKYVVSGPSYLSQLAGNCSGDFVILPNGTAWLVYIWLIPRDYLMNNPVLSQAFLNLSSGIPIIGHYNSSNGYAEITVKYLVSSFVGLEPKPMSIVAFTPCYWNNDTILGNYYVAICGDVIGFPISMLMLNAKIVRLNSTAFEEVVPFQPLASGISYPVVGGGINWSFPGYFNLTIPQINTTYYGFMTLYSLINVNESQYYAMSAPIFYAVPGPECTLNVVYAPNPQAALYITLPRDYIELLRESGVKVYGFYVPNDVYMGFWVWRQPGYTG
ncbi:hypothetical protein [Vulcanisaeta distributa]|uniref:hypothetical protein n=1 Tax=Vulcanisaeta distributa TaxID=164451 RepID=UPI0006D239FF|nr:hypothetical protein [Vulcanisaeta distributa]